MARLGVGNKGGELRGAPHGKVFCVDKNFLTSPQVQYVYGCRDPDSPGALLQTYLGLTLDVDDGPNSYFVESTVSENDGSRTRKAFFGNFSQFCYVFYGEEHFQNQRRPASQEAGAFIQEAAQKFNCRELVDRAYSPVQKNASAQTLDYLLNDVFALSDDDKSRAVLYVAALNPALISLMEGNLIVAKESLKTEPNIAASQESGIAARSVLLFAYDSMTPIKVDAQVTVQGVEARLDRFYHHVVSENVRTAEVLHFLSGSGLDMDQANEALVASLMKHFRTDDSPGLYRKLQHFFNRKCTGHQMLKEVGHIVYPSIVSGSTVHVNMEALNLVQHTNESMYFNNVDSREGTWRAFASAQIGFLADFIASYTASHIKSVPSFVPESNPAPSLQFASNGEEEKLATARQKTANYNRFFLKSRITEEQAQNASPLHAWVVFGLGMNPHLTRKTIDDCELYLQLKKRRSLFHDPVVKLPNYASPSNAASHRYKMKPVTTMNVHNPYLGSQIGPFGNATCNYAEDHKEVRDHQTAPKCSDQMAFIKHMKRKLSEECSTLKSFFEQKRHAQVSMDRVIGMIQDAVAPVYEFANAAYTSIRERPEDPLRGEASKISYVLQCSSEPYAKHPYGPLLGRCISFSNFYRLKSTVSLSLLTFGFPSAARVSQLTNNVPTLGTLFTQNYFDKNSPWTLKRIDVSKECQKAPVYDAETEQFQREADVSLFEESEYTYKSYTIKAPVCDYISEAAKRMPKSPYFRKTEDKKSTFAHSLSVLGVKRAVLDYVLGSRFDLGYKVAESDYKHILAIAFSDVGYASFFMNTVFSCFFHGDVRGLLESEVRSGEQRYVVAFLIGLLSDEGSRFCNLATIRSFDNFIDILYYCFCWRFLKDSDSSLTSLRPFNVVTSTCAKGLNDKLVSCKRAPSAPNTDLASPGLILTEEELYSFQTSKIVDSRFTTAQFKSGYPPASLYDVHANVTSPKSSPVDMLKSFITISFFTLNDIFASKAQPAASVAENHQYNLMNRFKVELSKAVDAQSGVQVLNKLFDFAALCNPVDSQEEEENNSVIEDILVITSQCAIFQDVDVLEVIRAPEAKRRRRDEI